MHIAHYFLPRPCRKFDFLRHVCAMALGVILIGLPEPATAKLALIMFTSDHCPYCMAWEREVGTVYDKSTYAETLPLTRLEYGSSIPDDIKIAEPVLGTPTFVILENGTETGRITGYSGAEMFWWQLSEYVVSTHD